MGKRPDLDGELMEWQTLSELFPEQNKPEDDYEEIES